MTSGGDEGGRARPGQRIDWDCLATRIRDGDDRAFDELYLALFTPLAEFAAQQLHDAATAEDIVQDVFQSLWDARRDRVIQGIRIYMYSAVKKRVASHFRRRGVIQRMESAAAPGHSPALGEAPALPDSSIDASDLQRALAEIIRSLPRDRQTIVMLRWRHQLSYPEIAELLGISLPAAQAQVSRVQRAIRPLLARFVEPDR